MRFFRLRVVAALLALMLLTACNLSTNEPRANLPTRSVPDVHLPAEFTVGPWRLPVQLAWLDDQTLVYTSRSGIELLPAAGGAPQTLAGTFHTVAPAPDTKRIAFWGEGGVGIATREPLAVSQVLWPTAEMTAWAVEHSGQGAQFVVDELHWSPDGRELGLLIRALSAAGAGVEPRTTSALFAFDLSQGKRTAVMTRPGREGSIRTFRWNGNGPLLIQYQTTPDHEGPGTRADTTDLIITWDKDLKVSKPMGTLPYPLTLAAVNGQTVLFNPTHREYSEEFTFQPYTGSLQVGMKPDPVGEKGQTGLLSPRDGQFVALTPDQTGAVISRAGDRLAVPVAKGKGLYSIRIDELPAPASTAIELNRALPIEVTLAPAPTGNSTPPDITDVAFRNELQGFGVTWHGAIYETGDGGATWHLIYQDTKASFQQIRFAPDGTTFVLGGREGAGGPILLTSGDSGRTWTEKMAQGLRLNNVLFADAERGYAVKPPDQWYPVDEDLRGRILATEDGGRTWEPRSLPEGASASGGIAFIGPLTGFVTASTPKGSAILYTADGGKTWETRYTGDVTLYSLQFLDAQTGFAGGGIHYKAEKPPRQFLLRTDDGGRTWQEIYRGGREGGNISRLQFLDKNTGWAALGVGSMGQSGPIGHGLAFTSDGGRTWQYPGSTTGGWSGLGDRLWTVSGGPDRGQSFIRQTTDGGAHWQTLAHPSAIAVERLALVDPKTGWLQTNFGLYQTTDGARTWKPYVMSPPVGEKGWGATFLTPRDAVAVFNYELLRSRDGGQTWQTSALPDQAYVSRTAFADPENGWAYDNDKLYATRDGGQTWERLSPGLTGYVQSMAFGDATNGVAAAGKSLLVTADGGRTWSGVPLGSLSLHSASYTKDGHIWLAGSLSDGNLGRDEGAMLHSPDRGKTWQVYRSGDIHPGTLAFADKDHGWMTAYAGGRSGILLVTVDGGRTWKQLWPDVTGR